jgi:hypothetical protein
MKVGLPSNGGRLSAAITAARDKHLSSRLTLRDNLKAGPLSRSVNDEK